MPTFRSRHIVKSCIVLAPAISGCLALGLLSQATLAQSDASTAATTTSYLPSISDFMIATIQPRHVRLWVAARSKDWPFAAYELGNLKGAFDRLGQAHRMEHEIPLQDMISSVTARPFEDLHKAILAKDTTAFDKAYGALTSACNACHQGTNHGVVVIRTPTDAALSDQYFERGTP
ncbi:cytochrome family protein [Bradyrhizobium sp.]|uniref:cytochrome family protein n=1 Tax=Bradyrhizobium sp. TaxID=376 RepID=UPI003C60CC4D